MDSSSIFRKAPDIECIDINDGAVLKDRDKIHVLNQTAFQIFELIDGCRNVEEIVNEMKFLYPGDEVENFVRSFITQMSDSGLVQE